ncbi:MAG TPA: hypothetical protein VGY53_07525 [Isosphaeraceae bacterium]|nr:hypothetical protein [Isosphaeraceae bacterium]
MQLGKYLKSAFLYHWNLLAFLGGLGFAALSGQPDVVGALVLAGEVAYLGMLGTHPKFQKYVDAQESSQARQQASVGVEQTMFRILQNLPDKQAQRFRALRSRCLELRQIASDLKDPGQGGLPTLDNLQLTGLDRLLWIYLRLLYTQTMLERFFQKTSETQIQKDIQGLEERIRRTGEGTDDLQKQKLKKALQENLDTCKERLANYQKARDNSELVQAEADHLENKIRALAELAVNRQDPDYIVGQVDLVASGLVQTERTMNELQFATGLDSGDDAVPAILRKDNVAATTLDDESPRRRRRELEDDIRYQ